MARRAPAPPRAPFWHPSRLTWVNGLGFALTLFVALWLILALFKQILPDPKPVKSGLPAVYILFSLLTSLATVIACGVVVFGYAWRGADIGTAKGRTTVLFWSVAGLVFFICQTLVLVRFGAEPLPKLAPWAASLWWGIGPVGLPTFALMTWVNSAHQGDGYSDSEYGDDEYDEDEFADDEYAAEDYD